MTTGKREQMARAAIAAFYGRPGDDEETHRVLLGLWDDYGGEKRATWLAVVDAVTARAARQNVIQRFWRWWSAYRCPYCGVAVTPVRGRARCAGCDVDLKIGNTER